MVWQKRDYELVLAPGEYAVLGGSEESYRKAEADAPIKVLPMLAAAGLNGVHRIPLESWTRVEGNRHEFKWSCRETLGELVLEVPETYSGKVEYDGVELSGGKAADFYADHYRNYELPAAAQQPGEHTVALTGELPEFESAYLTGKFETALWSEGADREKCIRVNYNITVLAPRRFTLELSPVRSKFRTDSPLSEQGLNFYDGSTSWEWEFTLDRSTAAIDLAGTAGVCDVEADGKFIGRLIAEPYRMTCLLSAGEHRLKVTLYGSSGAIFEGGNAKVQLGTIRLFA